MILKNLGYIINVSSNITGFESTNVIREDNGRVIAEGILQTADELNRNRRIYPKSELFPQLRAPRTLELLEAGYLRAELGHPLSTQLTRQQVIDDSRTCAQFLKLWTEGNDVWGRFRGTNNAFGESFDRDLRDGCKPAWSLRALGTLVQTPRGAEVHNLNIITWDQVIYPSHPGAYTQRIVSESADLLKGVDGLGGSDEAKIIPYNTQDVVDYIKSESANLKYVKECFDFASDSIIVNEGANSVTLTTKDGDVLVINLEKYISNEIQNASTALLG